jgi:hypothetical protein
MNGNQGNGDQQSSGSKMSNPKSSNLKDEANGSRGKKNATGKDKKKDNDR